MKQIKRLLTLAVLCVCVGYPLQAVTVSARIDSASILMGEQTFIRFQVSFSKGKELGLPATIGKFLPNGIELLNLTQPDSTEVGNDIIQVNQDFLVTSFDSALYYIDPIPVVIGRDTFYSNSLVLKVIEIPVDTTQMQIVDIQGIVDAPFVWADWHWWVTLFFALVAAILWTIFYLKHRKMHPKSLADRTVPLIKAPAEEVALIALESLKQQKLWQQERLKEYYTSLTDILRNYLEQQFGIDAVEMTSREIWDEAKRNQDLRPLMDELVRLLEVADLVKFAKYHSLPDENDRSWMIVKHIVETSTESLKERLIALEKERQEAEK